MVVGTAVNTLIHDILVYDASSSEGTYYCAEATSGIAGPGGGTPTKPVGTVWMAAKCGDRVVTQVKQLPGDRDRVITRATLEAQLLLLSLL